MSRALTIENDTHWKTSDIKRIVRAALEEGGASLKKRRAVHVVWQDSGSRVTYQYGLKNGEVNINIHLPKRGPKVHHNNALVALAAAGIDNDTPMLAVSDSYFLANALAWEFACETSDMDKRQVLDQMKRSTNPPPWGDGTTLIITKYADPLKDGTYRDFVAEKERLIGLAKGRKKNYEEDLKKAQKGLRKAQKDIKKHQDAIATAKANRTKKKVTA